MKLIAYGLMTVAGFALAVMAVGHPSIRFEVIVGSIGIAMLFAGAVGLRKGYRE